MSSTPAAIIEAVGGASNVRSLTHCATRLRFQLIDGSRASKDAVERIPGVAGAVPQSGDRFQVVIGGAVDSVYKEIMALPDMAALDSGASRSNDDVKAAARSQGPRGRFSWLDTFFEFLSDSFRPIIGALLGASLIITFMSLMATTGVIGNWADSRVTLPPSWQFVNLMWQTVFYFLPLMVAYNASKKLDVDPWLGFAIMAFVMLPGFTGLESVAHSASVAGTPVKIVEVFGLPLTIFNYGSTVFPPLLMAAVLGPLYKGLKKLIPQSVQLIFVPFLSLLVMIPLTAFLIGPIGVYLGAYLAKGLATVNSFRPLIFAIIIPLAYPFMVPLGLHWPLNAVMLLNIQTLGYDYIQGPMGAWNFACFGATAGVLALSVRNHEETMRQTAVGALAAGLLGGISEPSLYGIHLRYKRIYPSMLVGCLVGGVIIGIGGGLHTQAFIFTSLLTIPAFDKIGLYCVAIAASFVISGLLVFFRGYQDPQTVSADGTAGVTIPAAATPVGVGASTGTGEVSDAETSAAVSSADQTTPGTATPADVPMGHGGTEPTSSDADQALIQITSPVAGRALPIEEVPDPVFSTGVVGQGIAIDPTSTTVVAPATGTVLTAPDSGHALGLKLDNGVELLIHIGIDTVELDGKGFDVHVKAGEAFRAGQPLVTFDPRIIKEAGYSSITPVLVTNGFAFTTVEGHPADTVTTESQVITVTR